MARDNKTIGDRLLPAHHRVGELRRLDRGRHVRRQRALEQQLQARRGLFIVGARSATPTPPSSFFIPSGTVHRNFVPSTTASCVTSGRALQSVGPEQPARKTIAIKINAPGFTRRAGIRIA
jgi:hypothetical protein